MEIDKKLTMMFAFVYKENDEKRNREKFSVPKIMMDCKEVEKKKDRCIPIIVPFLVRKYSKYIM